MLLGYLIVSYLIAFVYACAVTIPNMDNYHEVTDRDKRVMIRAWGCFFLFGWLGAVATGFYLLCKVKESFKHVEGDDDFFEFAGKRVLEPEKVKKPVTLPKEIKDIESNWDKS